LNQKEELQNALTEPRKPVPVESAAAKLKKVSFKSYDWDEESEL
jgi:hypothetical protein